MGARNEQHLGTLGRDFIRRASHRYSHVGFCSIRFMMPVALVAVQLIVYSFILTGETRAQTLASLPATVQLLTSGNGVRPTRAWIEYCEQLPDECAINSSEPFVVRLTPAAWRTIVSVNARVNRVIRPRTDQQHWGVEDRWNFPDDGYGDCEDYQILKRKLLVKAGLPRRALRMAVVIDKEGAGHAVLMVRTDQGEFILDNKTNAVLSWSQTGYIYVKREGDTGRQWVSLSRRISPMATANR